MASCVVVRGFFLFCGVVYLYEGDIVVVVGRKDRSQVTTVREWRTMT